MPMLDTVFHDNHVVDRLLSSSLGTNLDDLAAKLSARGYSERAIQEYMRACGHFAYWLDKNRIPLQAITEETMARFLEKHVPKCSCIVPRGGARRVIHAALGHLLIALRNSQQIPQKPAPKKQPFDTTLDAFRSHLIETRGNTEDTCCEYSRIAREFLRWKFGIGPVDLRKLTAADLMKYVANRAQRAKSNMKGVTCALRSFARFMQLRGFCDAQLVNAIPTVSHRKLANLPKSLTAEQLGSLLRCSDRSTAAGRRDYAMILCLAHLGLRAGEVAQLSLDDIDWRGGVLRITTSKVRRASVLPLPEKVGKAIAAYLRKGRPSTSERRIFVRHLTPKGSGIDGSTVRAAVRRAFERSGMKVASKGSHVLRHTVGTLMIQRGATLKEIADVLRHRNIDTTAIYSKVDLPTLRSVALPWPEVRS